MKKTALSLMVIISAAFFATASFAQSEGVSFSNPNYEIIETNYLEGLNSDNHGLAISCAYFLGNMKSQKAVIPLMRMFNNAKNDGEKLVAGWALLKIGDARGIYLVEQECATGDCEGIRCMLDQLYQEYYQKAKLKTEYEVMGEK